MMTNNYSESQGDFIHIMNFCCYLLAWVLMMVVVEEVVLGKEKEDEE